VPDRRQLHHDFLPVALADGEPGGGFAGVVADGGDQGAQALVVAVFVGGVTDAEDLAR
jgi:hypothetical protein